MSNKSLKKSKPLAIKHSKSNNGLYQEEATYTKKFRRFNIFTKGGENHTVTAPYSMTLDEAMHYFNALSIGGEE